MMIFQIFLTLVSLMYVSLSEENRENTFSRLGGCPVGFILPLSPVSTDVVGGRIQCVLTCVEESLCISVNACPNPTGGIQCQRLGSVSNGMCSDLQRAPGCVHLQPANICKNGGVFNNVQMKCDCPYDFTGTYCERCYYDCSEAYSAGMRGPTPSNIFREVYIQPLNAPSEFLVECYLSGSGWTVVEVRNVTSDFNRTWSEYKIGWSEYSSRWIGLDNMHYITNQAGLRCKFSIKLTATNSTLGNFYYNWFTVDNESNKYTLTYTTQHAHPRRPIGDGFAFGGSAKSIKGKGFATSDRPDPQECAVIAGAGWWYGDQCPDANLHKRMSSDGADTNVAEWPDVGLNLEKVLSLTLKIKVFR